MNCNENILKLIITNFTLLNAKQLYKQINSKQLAEIILEMLDYRKIFKSMGESKIILCENTVSRINCLTLLPGNKLASYSYSVQSYIVLKIWDLKEYKCFKTLEEDCHILSIITLPGLKIATGSNKRIRIFSIEGFECIKTLDLQWYKHFGSLLLLPDQTLACTAYLQNKVQILIFDLKNDYTLIKKTAVLVRWVFQLINLSNNRFASSSSDKIIRIWDIKGWRCIQQLGKKMNDMSMVLLFIEKDNLLLSGSKDSNVLVWSTETYQCIKNVKIKLNGIKSLLLLPNRYLACGSYSDGKIMILNLDNYECLNIFEEKNVSSICSLILLNDKRIISSGEKIIIWNY
jgi:WD40 repeat protein